MAAMHRPSPSTAKRQSAEQQSAKFKAEQVRLKEEAARRRAEAARREADGEPSSRRTSWSQR
ncbi:hypothetical protein [Conexibacter woesei]|uniref:Uncharacterized protein n=1 Tax=Conexibacter woesei (strain DSM 14684 / CCUG 47730 / CIP 108061 / JCM 11494 / NBRC 100937 / ID131577) TaxID=469383 RepID=D3FCS9_CONWI|nr:hypothetical protein [Conexibacter woesei]ADB51441.1 hypothetical protein Cwoe_3022 [Conexibacter woesei DSM 14684]